MSTSPDFAAGTGRAPNPVAVVLCGIASSALALGGVQGAAFHFDDFQVMGWYWLYAVPVGAILVGAIASSGYALGSWWSGVKISGGLLAAIVVLQTGAYFAGQYLEFRMLELVWEDGSQVSFWAYFDLLTRSYAFNEDDGSAGFALGGYGYVLRVLEVVGFAGASLFGPIALRDKPYCEPCALYMRDRQSLWFAASLPAQKLRKLDAAERENYEASQQSCLQESLDHAQALTELATDGDAAGFAASATERAIAMREAEKLPVRMRIRLSECPGCEAGQLGAWIRTGDGQEMREEAVARLPLTRHFVRRALQNGN
ncbi:MAG: hypothetical protein AAF430_21105 [Myxococcota bacterium]